MPQKIVHEVPAHSLVAAVLQSDAILMQLQRELYRLLPGITAGQLRQLLREQILRREVIEGHDAEEAGALLKRVAELRAKGLTTTQTMQVVTDDAEEDGFHILRDDKRSASGGG